MSEDISRESENGEEIEGVRCGYQQNILLLTVTGEGSVLSSQRIRGRCSSIKMMRLGCGGREDAHDLVTSAATV